MRRVVHTARARTHATALSVVALLTLAPTPALADGLGATAPTYLGNTLRVSRAKAVVAGTIVRVQLDGHARWRAPTGLASPDYSLWLYAQNADVDGRCEPTVTSQRQKAINIAGLGASETLTDWVVNGTLRVAPKIPESDLDWAIDSLPFVIKPGVRQVLLCGYERALIDDVATYELSLPVAQPTCRLRRTTVGAGGSVPVKCNLSGTVGIQFGSSTQRAVRLRAADGSGALSTLGTHAGTYQLSWRSGSAVVSGTARLTIR
jgi:hypothetical protein